MKYLTTIIFVLSLSFSFAQDTTQVEVVAPKIVTNLANGTTYNNDNISIKFLKVVTDSRCPKNVNCIRAREAEVLIAVLKNGKEIEQKTILIHPFANIQKKLNLIFHSEVLSVSGLDLLPYPVHGNTIKAEDYVLQIQVGH